MNMVEQIARRMALVITAPGEHPDAHMAQCAVMARAAIESLHHYNYEMEQAGMKAMEAGEPFEIVWRNALNAAARDT